MVRAFELPDVGEGLTEAEIVAWHVEPGDPVTEDQIVAEVETDKAVVEVPSPVDGTVKEIHADPGEVVAVGEVIITFDVDGAPADEETETDRDGEPAGAEAGDTEAGAGGAAVDETDDPGVTGDEPAVTRDGRVFAAPSARRLAREEGVDLSAVSGSGPGGRVTAADVRGAAETDTGGDADDGGADAAAATRPEDRPEAADVSPDEGRHEAVDRHDGSGAAGGGAGPASETGESTRDRTLAAPATRRLARELDVDLDAVPAVEERDGEAYVTSEAVRTFAEGGAAAAGEAPSGEPAERVERVPYRGVRRSVGEQMERSAFTAPHVTHHDEADVTDLVEIRDRLRPAADERGVHLTYLPFVIQAVVAGLREHPVLNAELDEAAEEILLKRYYNVGIATATEAGLMVPVVEDADQLSLLELAATVRELSERARDRSITREEMQGGTFTITNFGAIGGEYATPIINYPEVAILGLGAIKEKPRVVDGDVVARTVLTLSLSIDHRVVDGADAAAFVNTVKAYLEAPERLLLE